MPTGVYKRTKEHSEAISRALKGRKNPNMARCGKQNGMYGTTGHQEWRNISGLKVRRKGEYKPSKEAVRKIALANTVDNPKYSTIHTRLRRNRGKANYCELCGRCDERRYEWACTVGKMSDKLEDYVSMCVPCHREYDGTNNFYLHSPLYQERKGI